MENNVRFTGAIILSVLLHGLLLVWNTELPSAPAQPPIPDLVLDLVLEPQTLEQELETEPEIISQPAPVTEQPESEQIVETTSELPPESKPATLLSEELAELKPVSGTPLKLERPSNWDELVAELPAPDVIVHFNSALQKGIEARDGVKRRHALVAGRLASVYGVPDELYTREGPLGTEIKINGRCYVLSDQPSIEAGTRWWRSTCTDTRQNPFTLAPIEYDAIGRVVAD